MTRVLLSPRWGWRSWPTRSTGLRPWLVAQAPSGQKAEKPPAITFFQFLGARSAPGLLFGKGPKPGYPR